MKKVMILVNVTLLVSTQNYTADKTTECEKSVRAQLFLEECDNSLVNGIDITTDPDHPGFYQ